MELLAKVNFALDCVPDLPIICNLSPIVPRIPLFILYLISGEFSISPMFGSTSYLLKATMFTFAAMTILNGAMRSLIS